jgi:putative heme utilization carrier protein HutX
MIDECGYAATKYSGGVWDSRSGRELFPLEGRKSAVMNSQGERKMTLQLLDEQQRQALRERLAANPGGILEQLADAQQCSLVAVVECLPRDMWRRTDGSRFVEAMQTVAAWRTPVTVIVHTADVVMEFHGPLPPGSVGHGFYNLQGDGGLHGHLRHSQCASIHLVERPFMGRQSACLLFANRQGQAMFKVFAGRDESGALRADQLRAMRELMAGEEVPA